MKMLEEMGLFLRSGSSSYVKNIDLDKTIYNKEQTKQDIIERTNMFESLVNLGAVHIGSSRYTKDTTNPHVDIDLAVSVEIMTSFLSQQTTNLWERVYLNTNDRLQSEFKHGVSHGMNNELIRCDYNVEQSPLLIFVHKLVWRSGITMDLLFYYHDDICTVEKSINVLLTNDEIWEKCNKQLRIELFNEQLSLNKGHTSKGDTWRKELHTY